MNMFVLLRDDDGGQDVGVYSTLEKAEKVAAFNIVTHLREYLNEDDCAKILDAWKRNASSEIVEIYTAAWSEYLAGERRTVRLEIIEAHLDAPMP